jgi:NAD(P)-dependent dehydrogenase (short-subunit alcohol dehydrogenase family)
MYKERVVVITGAGSGIGRALAVAFAAKGAKVALADINQSTLAETMALLARDTEARAYPLDVASRDAVQRFAASVHSDFKAVHLVFNNAGLSVNATVEHLTVDELTRVIDVNLWGAIYGTKAFLPIMLEQRDGCIVNISSVFGLLAPPVRPHMQSRNLAFVASRKPCGMNLMAPASAQCWCTLAESTPTSARIP